MTIVTNPDTGESLYLDNDGSWKPAKTAVNPQTREMMAYDGKDWQKVSTHGHGILSYVDDAVRAIASGATFGYADTIAAKMNELVGRGSYETNLQAERARSAEAPAALRIPLEIAGGVAGAAAVSPVTGALGAATGLSKLPAAAKLVLGGAAAGGAYASGEAEPGQRLAAVPEGAVTGALTGGAAAGVGRVLRSVVNPSKSALAQLSRALQRDNLSEDEALSQARQLAQDRPGTATLADVGGENVRGLMERVAQTPGAGRSVVVPFLSERQTGQMSRLANDLQELSGSRRTALQAVTETMAQRAEAAQPLYRQAYEAGDNIIWSDGLERLSSSPTVRNAMQGAVRIWRDNAVADGFGAMNPGASVERGGQLEFLSGKVPVFPNLQFWDYTKRLIDDKVQSAIRSGQNQKARTLGALARNLRGELDRLVPEYSAAREAWAGPSSYLNAVESGRNILSKNVSAEEMRANFGALSQAEQAGFREGAVSSIIGRMGGDAAKLADMTKYLRSPEMRDKIAAIMPDPAAAKAWQRRLSFEIKSSELTGQALRGSQTARRLAEMADARNIVGDLVMDAFAGSPPLSLMRRVIVGGAKRVRDTLRSRTDAELAKMLTGRAPPRPAGRLPLGPTGLLLPPTVGATSGLIQR